MNKIHLSQAQRDLLAVFRKQSQRPNPKEYNAWQTCMKTVSPKGKLKIKGIPKTQPGFHRNEIKLEETFDAFFDLPEGWAATTCWDSGGNHVLESAGQAVLRDLYNYWDHPRSQTTELLG